jgi:excisionase family DNA binding protein
MKHIKSDRPSEPDQRAASGIEPLGVSVAEACRLTSLGRTKVYELMAEGILKWVVIGRRRIVLMSGLRDYFDLLQGS